MNQDTLGKRRYSYEQVAAQLEENISSGRWRGGDQLPNLETLVEQFGFSRMTVFKAMQLLESRGLITMSRGRGTFVRKEPARPTIGFVTHHLLDQPMNGFSTQVAHSLENLLHKRGWTLRLYSDAAGRAPGLASWELVEALEKEALTALVTVNSNLPVSFMKTTEWERLSVPHVDLSVHQQPAHRVTNDHQASARLLLEYCRSQQITELAIFGRITDEVVALLTDGGVACPEGWRLPGIEGKLEEESGYLMIRQVWEQPRRPRALYVSDDIVAKGVQLGLLALQVKLPDELLMIAATNSHSRIYYPLPMVQLMLDADGIAREMLDLLDGLIANPHLPSEVRWIASKLVDGTGTA